jgi:PEP-CTERM motif
MRLPSLLRGATLALVIAGFATAAYAGPITYQISSTASGTIGGTTFTNALVTLTGTGDTNNIVSVFGFAFAAPITTTVTIQGIGTATINDPTEILSSVIPVTIGNLPTLPLVILGRVDSPPALESFTGIAVIGNAGLLGYNLATSFGPITTIPGSIGFIVPCGVAGSDPCLSTSLGTLSFTSNLIPTSQGTFSATVQPVPEPTSLFLMGSGIAALVGRSRVRRRG